MFDIEKMNRLMNEQSISYYQLMKTTGASRGSIYALKNGKTNDPSYSTVSKIADALGVSLDELRKVESHHD